LDASIEGIPLGIPDGIPFAGGSSIINNRVFMPYEATCARFAQRGVKIEPAALTALSGPDEALSSAHLTDGRTVAIDALYLTPHSRLNSPLAKRLG
jgi:hypothetical protein